MLKRCIEQSCMVDNIHDKAKKKELCLSFLCVKTISAMHFFFFLVKKGYANAEIPLIFLLHFLATIYKIMCRVLLLPDLGMFLFSTI